MARKLLFVVVLALAGVSAPAASAQTTVSLEADAHVDAAQANKSFGGATRLGVAASPEQRAYLRFNVPAYSGTLTRATLRVRADATLLRGFDVRAVADTRWNENNLTYRNAPAAASAVAATSGALTTGAWVGVDVTALVRGSGRMSLALTTGAGSSLSLYSRESGSGAQLVLETGTTTSDTTPPDTTIASGPLDTYRSGIGRFAFGASEAGSTFECSLDGAAFAPCPASHVVHVANGGHTVRVRARDAAGNVDPTPATRDWWADALLQNGTFETPASGWAEDGIPIAGWQSHGASLGILTGGVAGSKLRATALTGADYVSVYDAPRSVDSTVAGRVYSARGQIRSDRPGTRVCLQLFERSSAGLVGSAESCVTTSTAWQAFPEVRLTARNGADSAYVAIQQDAVAAGDSFELDALEVLDGTAMSVPRLPLPSGDPVLLGFGDVAKCDSSGDEAVARLVDTLPGIIAMDGDTEQNNASTGGYAGCFTPAWGRHMWRIKPAVGDHEYRQPGAGPYWDTFGAAAGTRGKGWYSYDLGAWHIVVLNSNCDEVGGCGPGSEQYAWLEQDLAAHATPCLGAYFHHPLFSSGSVHGSMPNGRPFWDVLYRYSAEFVLGGNDHNYQRFAPQTPDGALDRLRGLRQFVVGVGGTMDYAIGTPLPNTEIQHSGTFGALQLTLHPGSYDWRFVPQEGKTFTDTGSTACSPVPATATEPPPPPPPSEPALPAGNLIADGGFEAGLGGWSGYQATVARVAGGAEGQSALRVAYAGSGSSFSGITTPVATTAAGAAYRATAWLRSAGAAKRVCLRIRERGAAGVLGAAETCLTASTTWQPFAAVSYKAVGGGKLDVYAYQDATPVAGDAFDLDAVGLVTG
ncbi:MAG TPA: DNRLRE domain-containing protein [Solirubrobacteraceae bacterium]|jgi:hypothetical protein